MYYELKGDYEKALDCYSRGKDHSKVSEILIRNGESHPGWDITARWKNITAVCQSQKS